MKLKLVKEAEGNSLQGTGTGTGTGTFRLYDKTITNSLADEPTEAGTLFVVGPVRNHKSTRL